MTEKLEGSDEISRILSNRLRTAYALALRNRWVWERNIRQGLMQGLRRTGSTAIGNQIGCGKSALAWGYAEAVSSSGHESFPAGDRQRFNPDDRTPRLFNR